jgi:multicomponent Na+:H+ antiporter subunit E
MRLFALNLLLAVIWLLLSPVPTAAIFAGGFLLGFALIAIFHDVLGSGSYVRRLVALGRFALVFLWEFLVANGSVVRTVWFRSPASLHPNFINYDVTGLKPFEILLLSYCISLTPGSTTVEVSDEFSTLVLHALDTEDPVALRARLDRVLKHGILRFTRSARTSSTPRSGS